jgi:hypothetical protein
LSANRSARGARPAEKRLTSRALGRIEISGPGQRATKRLLRDTNGAGDFYQRSGPRASCG